MCDKALESKLVIGLGLSLKQQLLIKTSSKLKRLASNKGKSTLNIIKVLQSRNIKLFTLFSLVKVIVDRIKERLEQRVNIEQNSLYL